MTKRCNITTTHGTEVEIPKQQKHLLCVSFNFCKCLLSLFDIKKITTQMIERRAAIQLNLIWENVCVSMRPFQNPVKSPEAIHIHKNFHALFA